MLEIGSLIDGKYKVLSEIGRGGMSVVYMAINEKANKTWAIKEVRKDGVLDFEAVKQGLIVETDMLKSLKHPNLPSIVDVIEDDETFLIVMDYIEGHSLEKALKEYGAQSQEHVIEWAKQLCDVLGYLHSRKPDPIIYRDMKPANVMLKPDGNIMLIDFGTARKFKERNLADTACLGTVGYAAPEQFGGMGQTDARTDIYCLGATLYHLITGCNPSEPPYEIRPIREINPELSSGLERIIQKCTQRDPNERYQSAAELMYALEHYWEYDEVYRKQQKKQLIKFLVPVAMTAVFGIGAMTFGVLENSTRKSNYDHYLLAAANSTDKAEEVENYVRAINLNPERADAYMGILQNGFLDDNVLTSEESEQLRNVLIQYGNGKNTNEVAFRENSKEYGDFAYETGIAYFYRYEEKTNKKNARGYFEIASEWESLDEQQRDRAKRLYTIADYYSKIGMIDEAGDASITYQDYWNDLVALSEGNLVEQDNVRTALVMYEELVSQVVSRTVEFKNDGVTREDILSQLKEISTHLSEDFSNMNDTTAKALQEEIDTLKKDIQKAEKIVQSTYGQTEQEGR